MVNEIFYYESFPVTFQPGETTMVNATEMAKPFGKRPTDWLRLPNTQDFIRKLAEVRKSHFGSNEYVITSKGGNDLSTRGRGIGVRALA